MELFNSWQWQKGEIPDEICDYIINNIDDGKLIVSESIPNIDFQKEVNDISNDLDPLDTLPPYTTLEDLVTDYGGS